VKPRAQIILLIFTIAVAIAIPACKSANTAGQDNKKGPSDEIAGKSSSGSTQTASTGNTLEFPAEVAGSSLTALDGSQFKLSDYKGKVVLLNLWATWCGPCKTEMPELVKISEEYRDKGLEVIGLNSDDEAQMRVEAFTQNMNITYRIGWTTPQLKDFLGPDAVPFTYIINREGKLTAAFRGFDPNRTPVRLRAKLDEVIDSQN
jgi:thiol-disulfide isomerase/thioredoxin